MCPPQPKYNLECILCLFRHCLVYLASGRWLSMAHPRSRFSADGGHVFSLPERPEITVATIPTTWAVGISWSKALDPVLTMNVLELMHVTEHSKILCSKIKSQGHVQALDAVENELQLVWLLLQIYPEQKGKKFLFPSTLCSEMLSLFPQLLERKVCLFRVNP